jgi:hypothetical protein
MRFVNHSYLVAVTAATAVSAATASLKDVKHVVLFMQENRAFDHVSPPFGNRDCCVANASSSSSSIMEPWPVCVVLLTPTSQ